MIDAAAAPAGSIASKPRIPATAARWLLSLTMRRR